MADSPQTSDLSEPPSDSDNDERLSTAIPSSRPSVDITHADADHHQLAPPAKRRRTGAPSSSSALGFRAFDRSHSSQPPDDTTTNNNNNIDDHISVSSDGWSSAPASPSHSEYALRDEAQTLCLWRDCGFGTAVNNDELVKHVQGTHCATGGPKKSKYVCEWGECQRKTSNHPSGYALKAHMRSHTKEKPYYCALPECDKAFTRSDALAKHMRTVHEPEQPRGTSANEATPPSKGGNKGANGKLKLSNGSASSSSTFTKPPPTADLLTPIHDEDGNEVMPSPANDNITYIPAHHPITGQPGFMIHYPPDVLFTASESAIPANELMDILRRQLHWAEQEQAELKREVEEMERTKKEEWLLKEILLDGVMEAELARADQEGRLADMEERVVEAMEKDVEPFARIPWTGGDKPVRPLTRRRERERGEGEGGSVDDTTMLDADPEDAHITAAAQDGSSPSPPPTGKSGGFDGENDPYDNYLAGRMAEFEAREKQRHTPVKPRDGVVGVGVDVGDVTVERESEREREEKEAETDAVGALMGMSGGGA